MARIIYPDQCAISSIVKRKDDRWVRLQEKLRLLLDRGTIICPTSQLHYEESVDVPGRYTVLLFSETNREQFMVYLDEIAAISPG